MSRQSCKPSSYISADHRQYWGQIFGWLIRGAREKKGFSIEETALQAGMSSAEWSAIEAGTCLPDTRQQLRSMADALHAEWAAMAGIVFMCREAWGLE